MKLLHTFILIICKVDIGPFFTQKKSTIPEVFV